MSESRYLAVWSVLVLGLAAAYFVLAALVDPYGLWGAPRISGFNAAKPAAPNKVRLVKPHQLRRAQATTVIIGNSRPEAGLDPDSGCWPRDAHPVYNFGIPGASVRQQFANALTAAALPSTQRLVVTVDFTDFLERRAAPTTITSPPLIQGLPGWWATLRDYGESTFSLDTLFDTLRTVAAQGNPLAANVTARGFNDGRLFEAVIRYEGQRVLFEQKNAELAARLQPGLLWINDDSPDFVALEQMLAQLASKDLAVVLAINPYHGDYLAHIERSDYGTDFERWKQRLAAIAQRHDRALWDFSTAHRYATDEAAPPSVSDWFYEPAHYNAALGERMLARVFGTCPELDPDPRFGRALNAAP